MYRDDTKLENYKLAEQANQYCSYYSRYGTDCKIAEQAN